MRKRSIPVLVVATVSWTLAWRIGEALIHEPLGYEMGATYPAPTYLRLRGVFALFSSSLGVSLVLCDFLRWAERKKL